MHLRRLTLAATVLTLLANACAPAGEGPGPAAAAPPPASPASAQAEPSGSSSQSDVDAALCAPLLLEPDLGFGTNVVMRRLPDAQDLSDLGSVNGLHQIVVALPEWPADFAALAPLQQVVMPTDVQLVVLLP